MRQHQQRYGIAKMAMILGVSRSGYYAWRARKPSKRAAEGLELSDLIRRIFFDHKGRYGSPRIWEELKVLKYRVSRKRVERLMRTQHLCSRRKSRFSQPRSCPPLEGSCNLLDRDFHATHPGEKWVSDITYLRVKDGWLYLTVIIDLWDRKIIGWSMSKDFASTFACHALSMAVRNRPFRKGFIFHSDQGMQYWSNEFKETLHRLCPSVRQSMSRKGNCWDNACAESFFKTLKTELYLSQRRYSAQELKTLVFEYIEIYYNRRRRHSFLGYAIPAELSDNVAA